MHVCGGKREYVCVERRECVGGGVVYVQGGEGNMCVGEFVEGEYACMCEEWRGAFDLDMLS